MFIGHFGAALAAKKASPETSLGTLFLACQLPDLVWPILVLLGIEKVSVESQATAFNNLNFESYPWSHGLLANLLMAGLGGLIYFLATRRQKSALLIGALILSHWFLDWIVHRPDLPLLGDHSLKVGLGLWNSILGTVVAEGGFFLGGLFLYLQTKSSMAFSFKRKIQFGSLILFVIVIYAMSVVGPQPEPGTSAAALAGPALAMWLLVFWAQRADRAPENSITNNPIN